VITNRLTVIKMDMKCTKRIESVRDAEYNMIVLLYLNGGHFMEYLTTAEQAKIWDISQRRVAIYCKEGRIVGAVLKGGNWLIPEGTAKPQDPRKERKHESK